MKGLIGTPLLIAPLAVRIVPEAATPLAKLISTSVRLAVARGAVQLRQRLQR